jgi:hypothetical protein
MTSQDGYTSVPNHPSWSILATIFFVPELVTKSILRTTQDPFCERNNQSQVGFYFVLTNETTTAVAPIQKLLRQIWGQS